VAPVSRLSCRDDARSAGTIDALMSARPERLDHYLVRAGIVSSRRAADELIASGDVSINGRRPRKGDLISETDSITIAERPDAGDAIVPDKSLKLDVLYEDAAAIVVNKPGGIPCHPLTASEIGTVMNAVAVRFPEAASAGPKPREGGLVHRLDNGTSGALIVARTRAAFDQLRTAIRTGEVEREYQALVAGRLDRTLKLDAPIAHHAKNAKRMVLGDAESESRKRAGRPALSVVEPIRQASKFTLVKVSPRTGGRHQIRVHLASAGHPIVGDLLYGGPTSESLPSGRFWLHLGRVSFESPLGGRVTIEAPLPPDLKSLLR
jgi:23S rRNA pseudouridine1911/1915/1917 synthase